MGYFVLNLLDRAQDYGSKAGLSKFRKLMLIFLSIQVDKSAVQYFIGHLS